MRRMLAFSGSAFGSMGSLSGVAAALALVLATACSDDASTNGAADGGSGTTGGGASSAGGTTGGGSVTPIGAPQKGEGTYYDEADGTGHCSFDATPNDLDVAAMNTVDYAGSAVCGACAEVTGPKGKVTVRIVDECPGCKKGDLDFSPQAFDKIGDHSAGRIQITWSLVPCAVTGNVAYSFKEGSSQYWTGIQVRNHKLPITKLEVKKNGAWVAIERATYNYFVDTAGAGPGAVNLRVTAIDGQTIEDTLPGVLDHGVAPGNSQFK